MDLKVLAKFRGTLIGVLVGDCTGAAFEMEGAIDAGTKLVLKKYLTKLEGPFFKAPFQIYTDDTAMTKVVAKALLSPQADYQKSLAVDFVKEYFKNQKRGYGEGISNLFQKWKRNKFEGYMETASDQYNGSGSYGNGGAMRISPVPLYCYKKSQEEMVDIVKKTTKITHTNPLAVNGAILQALAIRQNLMLDPTEPLDSNKYIKDLLEKFSKIEKGEDEFGIKEEKKFTRQLTEISKLLNKEFTPTDAEIINVLGHSVSALFSVPTAIYCFLKNSRSNCEQAPEHPFRRTLEYAIGLGGDSDTIASMACAISGAYYGNEIMPESFVKHFEASDEMIQLADQLCEEACK